MKIFKTVDLGVQLILLVAWLLYFLLTSDYLFGFYLIAGGWQLLSCLIHILFPNFYPYSGRKNYLWLLLFLFLPGFLFYVTDLNVPYLFILSMGPPIMALWYAFICYKEVKIYQQREWIQLK